MADKGFNGTTVSFAGTNIDNLESVDATVEGEVQATIQGDTQETYEAGIPVKSTTVEVKGTSTLAKGATGALVVAWNDGGALGSITLAEIKSVSTNGQVGAACMTTIVFGPSGT